MGLSAETRLLMLIGEAAGKADDQLLEMLRALPALQDNADALHAFMLVRGDLLSILFSIERYLESNATDRPPCLH